MTRIQYNELPNFSGFIAGKKIKNLALHFNQKEVPILVNEKDGYFDFFADPVLFEEHGYRLPYWLRIDSTLGLRIKEEGETLQLGNELIPIHYVKQIKRYEENKRYETTMPNRHNPHWVWKLVRKQEAFTFDRIVIEILKDFINEKGGGGKFLYHVQGISLLVSLCPIAKIRRLLC